MDNDNPVDTGSDRVLHILVLEDDAAHVELIGRAFEGIRHTCRVTFTGSIDAARSEIARDPPDLIIADWLLPDGKGIDILPKKDGHVTTPLIIMTSHGNEKLAVEMMKSGAIDYIIKSDINFIDLPHIVRRTFREWEHINMRIRMDGELRRNYQEMKVLNEELAVREEELRYQYEQLKAQETILQESEERQRLLLQYSGLGIGYWDYEGRLLFFNQKAAENMGGAPGEFIGKTMQELYPADTAKEYLERVQSLQYLDTNPEYEDKVSLPGGDRWFLSTLSNVKDTTGKKTGVQIISQEITEHKQAEEAMRVSEEKYRVLFTQMIVGNVLHELMYDQSGNPVDYRILEANPAFERITGLKLKDIAGKSSVETYGVDTPPFLDSYARVATTGISESFEVYFAPMKKHFAISVYSPERGKFATIFDDITARKQAEEALRESEAFLSNILDNIPTMVFVKNADDLRYIKINKGAEELLGYSRDEMVGKNDSDLFPEEEALHFRMFDREVLEHKSLVDIPEEKVATRNKGERVVHTRKIPICDTDGKARYLIGISEDITGTIEARERLAENEEKFRMIFDNANDSVYMVEVTPAGMPGKFLDVNAVFCSVLGFSREELLEKNILEINTPGSKDRAVANMTALFTTGSHTYETGHTRKDGTVVPVEVNAHLYKMKGNNVVIAVARDISQRKKEEHALRLANQKLQLMNIVAWHDIQNKITGLRGYVELSKDLISNEKAREFNAREEEVLRVIHEHLQHTRDYQEMGKQPLQWVNIPATLRRVSSMVDKGKVSVSWDIGELELFCDPIIEKVFFHLLDHTRSRGGEATTVRITCKDSPAGLLLLYEDDGNGIPAEEKTSIFVRDVAKTSGFGLYFIHDILELSEMEIRETGEPGVGTRFEITAPPGSYRFGGN